MEEESLDSQIAQAMKDGDANAVARLVKKRANKKADNEYNVRGAEGALQRAKDELRKLYDLDEKFGISKLQAEIFSRLSPAEIECFKREGIMVKDANGTEFYLFPNFNISDIQNDFHKKIKEENLRHESYNITPYRRDFYDKNGFKRDYPSGVVIPERDWPYWISLEAKAYEFVLHRHECSGYKGSRVELVYDKAYSYISDWMNYLSHRLPAFLKGIYANIYATRLETEGKSLLEDARVARAWGQKYGVQESADESEG
jgi:hypothetical protein